MATIDYTFSQKRKIADKSAFCRHLRWIFFRGPLTSYAAYIIAVYVACLAPLAALAAAIYESLHFDDWQKFNASVASAFFAPLVVSLMCFIGILSHVVSLRARPLVRSWHKQFRSQYRWDSGWEEKAMFCCALVVFLVLAGLALFAISRIPFIGHAIVERAFSILP